MEKTPLIILTGPTASGKSGLSIKLAKAVNAEIISADSMQVYRHMDIGSAKISEAEQMGIPHYLIDEFEPDEEFHVVRFQEYARRYIEQIREKGKIPLIVGGTGFYIQAVLYDIDFTAGSTDEAYRQELTALAAEKGSEHLHQMLAEIDPDSAEIIHHNNVKRVIRALEFYRHEGYPISRHNKTQRENTSPYQFAYFVLSENRDTLYKKIDLRVDDMLARGLIDEVKRLKDMGYNKDMVSMQGLGYKEILAYLDGEIDLERAVYLIKRDTRHFAKRQMTWFKREKETEIIKKEDFDMDQERILASMLEVLSKKQII